ncbi:hypothetical protein [Pseudonocardia sp. ICBG1293]|nr:hypothetical protein [Pseudonocardia sp. ICBG1293]
MWLTWWFTAPLGFTVGWWIAAELRLRRARRLAPASSPRAEQCPADAVSPAAVTPAGQVSAGQMGAGRAEA